MQRIVLAGSWALGGEGGRAAGRLPLLGWSEGSMGKASPAIT